ncbi:MAG TPA: LysR family transcriptional regulator, partial [Pseudobdellovibrionaceae bacterium]|nr:LysR family transcriptional regulator [Pseudobdellovibrionaceae bacterium]
MSFDLFYELQVLSSAVQYKNLSAAAKHIGLSQPQLSRIIQKIESHMNIVLLDRTAKKNSGWTKIASQISDAFLKNVHRMESDFAGISRDQVTSELHIGTLE